MAQPHCPVEPQMRAQTRLMVRLRLAIESKAVVSLGLGTGEARTARYECFVRHRKCKLKGLYTGKCNSNTYNVANNDRLHVELWF